MPHYLVQVAYTPEAWAGLVKNPQNRVEALRPVIENLGGQLEGSWLTFGEYDVVAIYRVRDNVNAAALSIAFSSGGAVKAVRTTPLITWEEALEALRKAGQLAVTTPRL